MYLSKLTFIKTRNFFLRFFLFHVRIMLKLVVIETSMQASSLIVFSEKIYEINVLKIFEKFKTGNHF